MTRLTPTRMTALARLSDNQPRRIDAAPSVIGSLALAGYIRDDMSGGAMQDRLWTITPSGIAALEAGV